MRIIELFTSILGFGISNADFQIYKPRPSNIVRRGIYFFEVSKSTKLSLSEKLRFLLQILLMSLVLMTTKIS